MSLLTRTIGFLPQRWIKAVGRLQWRHPLLRRAIQGVADRMRRGDQVIQKGVGKGLRFNARHANAGYVLGTSEPGLQRAFALLLQPGMVVYDVGANVGFQALLAAHLVTAQGRVLCFEPVPENARQVAHNAALNGFSHLTVDELALGDEDGEAKFIISELGSWGSLASVRVPARATGERKVQVRRLDNLVKERGYPPPGAIKCDVEGAEVQVLTGALETLRAARPILFVDLHGTNEKVASLLEDAGYALHGLGKGGQPIRTAPWDTQLIAFPREHQDLARLASRLTDPAIHDD